MRFKDTLYVDGTIAHVDRKTSIMGKSQHYNMATGR